MNTLKSIALLVAALAFLAIFGSTLGLIFATFVVFAVLSAAATVINRKAKMVLAK